jgi:uncharacterized protein with ParB-like and HNH nuclease domain
MSNRKIPETWFRAQTQATSMSFIMPTSYSAERFAPLGEGERKLGWFVLPPFQRPPVWNRDQQVRFVESLWMGLPVGVFVYNQTGSAYSRFDNWLLDGQQRVTAAIDYMNDEFEVFGHLFSQLTDRDHRQWSMGVSFPCMKTNIEDEAQLREVYDRLAYGGTAHEPK